MSRNNTSTLANHRTHIKFAGNSKPNMDRKAFWLAGCLHERQLHLLGDHFCLLLATQRSEGNKYIHLSKIPQSAFLFHHQQEFNESKNAAWPVFYRNKDFNIDFSKKKSRKKRTCMDARKVLFMTDNNLHKTVMVNKHGKENLMFWSLILRSKWKKTPTKQGSVRWAS